MRELIIENFRNIGLGKPENLVLNYSTKKGEIGNLVVLIGANNSGKSNVLDALEKIAKKSLNQDDVTVLSYDENHSKPSLTLKVKDGDEKYSYKITYGESMPKVFYPKLEPVVIRPIETKENIKLLLDTLYMACNHFGVGTTKILKDLFNALNNVEVSNEKIIEIEQILLQELCNIYKNKNDNYATSHVWDKLLNNRSSNKLLQRVIETEGCKEKCSFMTEEKCLDKTFKNKFGFEFIPKIYKYVEEKICDSNLRSAIGSIARNKFFNALFSVIDFKIKDLESAYSRFSQYSSFGILRDIEKKINKDLKKVAKKFNKLYFVEEETYKFEIALETNNIFFNIYRNDKNIVLNQQSTGFKWFFDLYFNLLASNSLSVGDIILMDEPATSLHVQGKEELRKILKDFAIKNDITIVLATHEPCLIDIDYLDEIRVIVTKDNIAYIENDFSTINLDDPDSLAPIKSALTVRNHQLIDPDNKLIFVEGITDYNYLVMFKHILGIKDVIFLPIRGIGDKKAENFKEKQAEISKKLIQIRKNNPILLVDNDSAGKAIKQMNKKDSELKVYTLNDIDEKFFDIESLFSEEDVRMFGIKIKDETIKKSSVSALLKTHSIYHDKVSDETKENFKKVLEYLCN